jgi:pyridinium-3,5-bisthiocarboxylic acid mononucleotide nickel chelatase
VGRLAYFDCFSGLSGEMILGALLGAGLPLDELRVALLSLPIAGCELEVSTVTRKDVRSTYLRVNAAPPYTSLAGRSLPVTASGHSNGNGHNGNGNVNGHASAGVRSLLASPGAITYTLAEAEKVLAGGSLTEVVRRTCMVVLRRISQAEIAVRGNDAAALPVRFPADMILVTAGVITGLSLLGIDRVECSPLHVGAGVTNGPHGLRPTLAPAAAEILRATSVPIYGRIMDGEPISVLGAALITTLSSSFGPMPAVKLRSVGYGAGEEDFEQTPNVVRLIIGEAIGQEPAASTGGPAASADPPNTTVSVRPFLYSQEDYITLTIGGHQQSGRQRLAG